MKITLGFANALSKAAASRFSDSPSHFVNILCDEIE